MNICGNRDCDKNIIEVKNVSTIWKGNFSKSTEVKFYIKSKNSSDLKVKQFTDRFCTALCDEVNMIIKVTNAGPDTENNGKLIDVLTNIKNLDIISVVLSKGSYSIENGVFIWNIGEMVVDEHLFAVITIKPKKTGVYKSVAAVYGENCDPRLVNNFSIEKILAVNKCCEVKVLICICILIALLAIWEQSTKFDCI